MLTRVVTPLLMSCLLGSGAGLDAATPALEVLTVGHTGCGNGDFGLQVLRSGLGGGRYVVRTQLTVDGVPRMDERAMIHVNGVTGWRLFDDFSYGSTPPPQRFPLPRGRPMQIELTLQRPNGFVVGREALLVDGCESGRVLARRALHGDGFE